MKKLPLLLLTCLLFFSCSENNSIDDLTSQKVEDLVFYNYDGEPIEQKDLVSSWNNMINNSETPYLFQAGTFSIKKIKTLNNDDFEYALIATNTTNKIQTAALITAFKEGYKISNRSVSCYYCDVNLELQSKDGYWSCSGTNENCVKTSRQFEVDSVNETPDIKILYSVQFTDEPLGDVKTLNRTIYTVYSNASTKDELCDTKSILSDKAYKEIWVIDDKNDPKQNRSRIGLQEIDAKDALHFICSDIENAIYTKADMEKFGKYKPEYKAFLD
ncbi:hypothetical protein [Nonlabens ulvanivorans]|uniref:Lipoprotein n=1 Tax=Nonlabens ulvanivorans TaxID=906888 RepID=A0A084JVP8_NONUL|nr:hypothetical protein [Nonlabens ulvanivorans]KEZ93032.1 hypothetical protein IL45_12960 [Nonlabens ulvanivorans]PRX12738.1 hypothetical protein LY02_02390 [Nonlabens ulvanivorans]